MKSISYLLLAVLFLSSCARKDHCPDNTLTVIPNKLKYFPWDPVKLKAFYSERATYTWTYEDKVYITKEDEFIIPRADKANYISCKAKVDNCKYGPEFYMYINVDHIIVPSCTLEENTFLIDNKKFTIAAISYNKTSRMFYGKLTGQGATVNDEIRIILPDYFEEKDSLGAFTVKNPWSSSYATLEVKYGNLLFKNYQDCIIGYRRTNNGGSVECCTVNLSNSSLPNYLSVKFKFKATF